MSENKGLIQMLAQCEKHEFDEVVKSFLKSVYKVQSLVLTDGKSDGGLDIKILELPMKKMQIQMTVQKSSNAQERKKLEKKIIADVINAQNNASKYGYGDRLEFFYSYSLTENFIEGIQMQAYTNYGINLIVWDAKRIVSKAMSYPELYKSILSHSGYELMSLKNKDISDKDKLFYDLVGFGEAADVKLKIVEAYILQCLFDEGSLTKDVIIQRCMNKFQSSENEQFYVKLLTRLHSRENRLVYDQELRTYSLSKKEHHIILEVTQRNDLDESMFVSSINEVLVVFHQEAYIEDYVNLLYQLYINNFKLRFSPDPQNTFADTNSLVHFASLKLKNEENAKSMIGRLVKICDENKFIQRNCAGKIFSSTIDIDSLKSYADNRKRVFIDTTLPLHMLCFYNYPEKEVKNYYYVLSCALYEFCKKNQISLFLTRPYFKEVVHHVWEAINLIPYSNIPGIDKLGGSKNVFYNFYHNLKDLGKLPDVSYRSYLDEMKFKLYSMPGTLEQEIEFQLKNMGIQVVDVNKKYDIENTRKLLDNELIATGKSKSQYGLT